MALHLPPPALIAHSHDYEEAAAVQLWHQQQSFIQKEEHNHAPT